MTTTMSADQTLARKDLAETEAILKRLLSRIRAERCEGTARNEDAERALAEALNGLRLVRNFPKLTAVLDHKQS